MKGKMYMRKWSLVIGCVLFLVAGCGTAQNNEKQAEGTSSVFVPMENEEETVTIKEVQGLCEVIEPAEVPFGQLYNAVNRIEGVGSASGESMFCVDEDTGVVYFVNFNKDWYIYRIKEGETKLAVRMPARELYMYDGSLYFMIDFYDTYELQEVKEGDIYCYTPSTGEIKFVHRPGEDVEGAITTTSDLTVKETGIHFTYIVPESYDGVMRNIIKGYYLPFGAIEPLEDSSDGTFIWWKDYKFSSLTGDDVTLCHKDDWSNQISLSDTRVSYCCVGDEVYYTKNATLYIKNLETGEQEEIDFSNVVEEARGKKEAVKLGTFVVMEEGKTVWSVCNSYLYCYDRIEGKFSYYENAGVANINRLYTDGTHLYADGTQNINGEKYSHDFTYTLSRIYTEQDEMSEEFRKVFEEKQQNNGTPIYMVAPLTQ